MRAVKPINSADNPRFKQLQKLTHSARERRKAGMSVLDGVHLIEAYLQSGGMPEVVAISATESKNSKILNINKYLQDVTILLLSNTLFAKLSSVESPTGIVAAVKTPSPTVHAESAGACVLLENIQDPGNLGSILRSTAAAGMSEIYLSKGCADAWSPRTLRAGMGAHFALHIHENVDLSEFIQRYKGKRIAACQGAARSIFDTDLAGDVAFIFGNEGAGVSAKLRTAAQFEAAIPMPGTAESLNVAAAATVCLFERVRQINAKQARK
jgi:TrmH family RNA methyltransferase